MTSRKLVISSGGRGRSCTYGVSNVTDLQSAALATRLTHPYGWDGGIRNHDDGVKVRCLTTWLHPNPKENKHVPTPYTIYTYRRTSFPYRPFRATDTMLIHVCM